MSDQRARTWLAPTVLGVFLLVLVAAVAVGVGLSSGSTTSAANGSAEAGSQPGSGGSTGSAAPSVSPSPSTSPVPSFAPGSPGGAMVPPMHNASPVPQESGNPIPTNYTVSGDPASNVLHVHTQRGGCETLDIHVAAQTAAEVILFVKLSSTATSGTVACPMYIQIVDQPVTLDAPLGTRSVIDQSTDKPISVN